MKNKTRITTITITKVALSTAIICILGPLSFTIPISPVPISLGILGIFFAVYVNGWLWGTVSCILYLLLGFVGVPVFTGFSAGAGKLLGPTGGYMIGYIFLSLVAGFFISKFEKNIPLHISRFFPRFHMRDKAPTDVSLIYHLADVARENLDYVYTGNC